MDEVIQTAVSPLVQMDLMLSYFKGRYPQGVLEIAGALEFMFYTDQEAKDSWDADGWTKENGSKMFHVICEEGRMTLVHEREDWDVIMDEIRKNLAANSCF